MSGRTAPHAQLPVGPDRSTRPAGRPGPGRRRVSSFAAAGMLLITLAALSVVWPVLAVTVLAGAVAVLLLRGSARWASQAWRGTEHRLVAAGLSGLALLAAGALVVLPVASAWLVGAVSGLLLIGGSGAILLVLHRRRRRTVGSVAAVAGLVAGALTVVVPAVAVAVATAMVVVLLVLLGLGLLGEARLLRSAIAAH